MTPKKHYANFLGKFKIYACTRQKSVRYVPGLNISALLLSVVETLTETISSNALFLGYRFQCRYDDVGKTNASEIIPYCPLVGNSVFKHSNNQQFVNLVNSV